MPSPEENKTNNSSVLNRVVEGHNHINQQQQQQQLHIHRQDNNIINIESDRESNGEQDEYDVENNQVNNDVVLVAAVEHEDDYRERHAAIGAEENERQLSSGEDEEEEEDDNEDFVRVNLSDIRKEVQCPICLGIIRKTRTMMECLHRFCRECIDKSMRLGNNECPACRKHCASRRSLRDDPNFDALIAAIYPDIDQYEEEDMSMQDDEKARNIQIQNSIEQTLRRQTEALTKKGKRVHTTSQRRRNHRSEDEEDSSGDERSAELKLKRSQRSRGLPSPTEGSGIGGVNGNYQAGQKETMVTSPFGVRGSLERLTWGRAGIRSNLRHRGAVGVNANNSHSRILKLAGHLRNLQENESEEIHVTLISLDQQKPYALQDAFIRCKPSLSMRQLCQFIALQTFLPADKVEILAEKGPSSKLSSYAISQGQVSNSCALKPCIDDLQVLDLEETLASVRTKYNFYQGHLILAFRQKVTI